MAFIDCASGSSLGGGYRYFQEKRVYNIIHIEKDVFTASVSGSAEEPYTVEVHTHHPRKSKCNCPHANGRHVICKHIMAAYFTLYPAVAEDLYADSIAYMEGEVARQASQADQLSRYVRSMKKSELEQALLEMLHTGPEWQLNRFMRDHGLDCI